MKQQILWQEQPLSAWSGDPASHGAQSSSPQSPFYFWLVQFSLDRLPWRYSLYFPFTESWQESQPPAQGKAQGPSCCVPACVLGGALPISYLFCHCHSGAHSSHRVREMHGCLPGLL